MFKRTTPVIVVAICSLVVGLVFTTYASKMPFPDVAENHWAYDAIAELAATGIVIGYPDGEYKGSNSFTRYEMAMVMSRLISDIEEYASSEIEWQLGQSLDSFEERITKRVAGELGDKLDEAIAAELDTLSAKFAEAMAVLDKASIDQKEEIRECLEKAKLGLKADFDSAQAVLVDQLTANQDAFEKETEAYVRALVTDLVAERLSELTPGLSKEDALEMLKLNSDEIAALTNQLDQVKVIAELASNKTDLLEKELADYGNALAEAQASVERALEIAKTSSEVAAASRNTAEEAMRIGNGAYSTAAEAKDQSAEIAKVLEELKALSDATAETASRAEAIALKVQQSTDTTGPEVAEMAQTAVKNSDAALTRSAEAVAYSEEAKALGEKAVKLGQEAQVSAAEALTVAKEGLEISKTAEQTALEASEVATKLQQVTDLLNDQMGLFDVQLAAMSKDVDGLKALIDLKTASIMKQLDATNAELEDEIVAVKSAISVLDSKNAVIDSKLSDLLFRIGRANKQVERIEAKLDLTEAELQEEFDGIKGMLSLFESRNAVLDSKMGDLLFRIERTNKRADRIEATISELKAELQTGATGLDDLRSFVVALDTEVKNIESTQELLSSRLAKVEQGQQELRVAVGDLEDATGKLAAQQQDLRKDHDALSGSFEEFAAKFGKVRFFGDTSLELVNRAVVAGDAAKLYKDPHVRDTKTSNPKLYDPAVSRFAHKLTFGFEAYPSDNVLVKGSLATVTNFFGSDPDFNVRLSDMSVRVETPDVLRLAYFGSLSHDEIAGSFDKYTINKKKIEPLKMFGVSSKLAFSDTVRADVYFSRLNVGEYLAAVYGEFDVATGKLYTRLVSWFTDPHVGAGAPAYARDRVGQIGTVGSIGNIDYDLKYTVDSYKADSVTATDVKLGTNVGIIDIGFDYGNVAEGFAPKYAKDFKSKDGDLLPDQRKYVLTASAPVFGAKLTQQVGRLDTSVTKGHYELSNITTLKNVDVFGAELGYERRDITTKDDGGESSKIENLLDAKRNILDFDLYGAYFTRDFSTTDELDHSIGKLSVSRKIAPFDLPVVLDLDVANLKELGVDDRQHYQVALNIDKMPVGPGVSLDATYQWTTREIVDNKWTELDKWQENRKTVGGLRSVIDAGDGLMFAAGYRVTTTEDLLSSTVTDKVGTASIGLDYTGELLNAKVGVGVEYGQSTDLLTNASLAPESKLSLTADRQLYGGSLSLAAKQSAGLDTKKSDRFSARTADMKYVYPIGNGFNISLSSNYAELCWDTNVDEDYQVWEALATVGFSF
ncbi:MAG: S-layer homology domain-containing protein [Limnochordia bacterium]|nr:S-layer homology domain-containing protein [Limnochordia bacterium]